MAAPILSMMAWGPVPPETRITLVLMHGDADVFTTASARFPLGKAGDRDANRLIAALEELPDAIARDMTASLESVCARLSRSLDVDAAELEEQLMPFVRADCVLDGHMAMLVAYVVEVTDESGQTARARFQSPTTLDINGCRDFGLIDPSHLKQWL